MSRISVKNLLIESNAYTHFSNESSIDVPKSQLKNSMELSQKHPNISSVFSAGGSVTYCYARFEAKGDSKNLLDYDKIFSCPIQECESSFNRKFNMLQHFKSHAARLGLDPISIEDAVQKIKTAYLEKKEERLVIFIQ